MGFQIYYLVNETLKLARGIETLPGDWADHSTAFTNLGAFHKRVLVNPTCDIKLIIRWICKIVIYPQNEF